MISVVMPVWINNEETLHLTKNAIDSLGDVFLILVDNASSVGIEYLEKAAAKYIKNSENLGFARAVNQGLMTVNTQLVAVANNDIRVAPNWQEVVMDVLKHPKVYSCHPRMTDYDVPFEYGKKIVYTGMEKWCTGSFFVIDSGKKLFLYDEKLLNSYDDWDYFYEVRQAGYYTAYTDKTCFQHEHSFTQKQILERDINDKRNAEYFKEKHGKYAEELFIEMYPDQAGMDWRGGFDL